MDSTIWAPSAPGKAPKPVSTQSVLMAPVSESLANLWQATLSGSPGEALWLVELRGFEPLTSCMPWHLGATCPLGTDAM